MANPLVTIDVDADGLLRLFNRLPATFRSSRRIQNVVRGTGNRVAAEAKRRLHSQLGPNATGATVEGIQVEDAHDGDGVVVVSRRQPSPFIGRLLDKGTANMAPREHFDQAAQLEEGSHLRRMAEAVQDEIDGLGL